MFFRKRPSLDYAVQHFEELVQIARTKVPRAGQEDTYHVVACVFGFYVHALRSARSTDEEVKAIIRQISNRLRTLFNVDEERLIADMSLVFDELEGCGDFYVAAAEAYHKKQHALTLDTQTFVGAVAGVCDYLCANFISKGFIKPDGSVAFLRFQRGLMS